MFKSRTIFVVGAGASFELGFPLGAELKERIATLVDLSFHGGSSLERGNHQVQQAIGTRYRSLGEDPNAAYGAGRAMSAALPLAISIDNYLEAHGSDSHVQLVGKIGIVKAILDAERHTDLYSRILSARSLSQVDFSVPRLQTSWLTRLVRNLTEGVRKESIERALENVSFITFNYDRSLEQFLWQALQRYYLLSDTRAAKILETTVIHHAYGSVGRLPWQAGPGAEASFGAEADAATLLDLSERILTFSEQVDDRHHHSLRATLADARTVVFLGFGFIEQNMQLLELQTLGHAERVYATAMGFSKSDCKVIEDRIRQSLNDESVQVELRNDLTASRLFDEYSRSITQ